MLPFHSSRTQDPVLFKLLYVWHFACPMSHVGAGFLLVLQFSPTTQKQARRWIGLNNLAPRREAVCKGVCAWSPVMDCHPTRICLLFPGSARIHGDPDQDTALTGSDWMNYEETKMWLTKTKALALQRMAKYQESLLFREISLILAYCVCGSFGCESRQSWKVRTEEVKSAKLKVTGGYGLFSAHAAWGLIYFYIFNTWISTKLVVSHSHKKSFYLCYLFQFPWHSTRQAIQWPHRACFNKQ